MTVSPTANHARVRQAVEGRGLNARVPIAIGGTVILMHTPCLSLLKHLLKVQGGATK